jgi:hypothetical protein
MGEHRTTKSKSVLEALIQLGEALGYDVRPEWKIPGTEPHSEQIDIALFVDRNARVPAFAIEVDSSDAPSSTSNAVKIFGKLTSALIKPFFVFHIFLETAVQGNRLQNTATLLSTHNYQTYDFASPGGRQLFLTDLLDRHRAIRSTISLFDFGTAIDGPAWDGVDRYALLDRAARELMPRRSELADRSALSIESQNLTDALAKLVCSSGSRGFSVDGLSFAGEHFLWPLFFGVRAYSSAAPIAASAFKELRKWQEEPEIIFSATSTFLGLSQDFDCAVIELAPLIFCVVALLFQKEPDSASQICQQLYVRATDGHLGSVWARYALAWCAVASLKTNSLATARAAIDQINHFGGLPEGVFPNLVGPRLAEDEVAEWEVLLSNVSNWRTQSLEEIKQVLSSLPPPNCSLLDVVARLLIENEYVLEVHSDIVRLPCLP